MIKIKSTTDYSRFKFIRGNRPIDNRVKKMIRAVKRKNQLADYPILVRPNGDGRCSIFDGQTRFEAAKQLKLPVFYIENKNIEIDDIPKANSTQVPWKARDYVHSWSERGNKHFQTLRSFAEEFGLPITTSADLLSGALKHASSANKIHDGTFRVTAEENARKVGSFIMALKGRIPFATDRSLANALALVMSVPAFDPSRFLQKLVQQQAKFVKSASAQQYIALIEEIYNFRVRPNMLVPLSIEARKLRK